MDLLSIEILQRDPSGEKRQSCGCGFREFSIYELVKNTFVEAIWVSRDGFLLSIAVSGKPEESQSPAGVMSWIVYSRHFIPKRNGI